MNPAATIRLAGFNALLASNGETLTFRGGPLQAIVNRRPERRDPQRTPDFQDRAATTIEFLSSAISGPPITGETLMDSDNVSHRIDKIPRRSDFTWRIDCIPTQIEAAGS